MSPERKKRSAENHAAAAEFGLAGTGSQPLQRVLGQMAEGCGLGKSGNVLTMLGIHDCLSFQEVAENGLGDEAMLLQRARCHLIRIKGRCRIRATLSDILVTV